MKAFTKFKYGGPEVLQIEEVEKPILKNNQLLVKVMANAANAADWHILRGKPFLARFTVGLFKPKDKILGADFAGIVEEVGNEITHFKKGDKVMVLPSGFTTSVKKIDTYDGELEKCYPPMSVTLLLEDDIDISRGDMIVRENNAPTTTQDIEIMLCWFDDKKSLQPNGKYAIKHTSQDARVIIKDIRYRLDINTLHRDEENTEIKVNDIARVVLRSTKPLFIDAYRKNRSTGSLILIDEGTNNTVGVGMII